LKTELYIFCRVTSCHLILCVSFTQAPWKRICIKILLLPWTSTRQPLIWTSKPVSMMHLHFTFKLIPIYCTFVKLVNKLDKLLPIQSKNQHFGLRSKNSKLKQNSRNLPVRVDVFSESFVSSMTLLWPYFHRRYTQKRHSEVKCCESNSQMRSPARVSTAEVTALVAIGFLSRDIKYL